MMKPITLAGFMTLFFLLVMALPAEATPKVIVDGVTLGFDVPPRVEQGTTLVPLRGIFEALGATVRWDGTTQTVNASKGNTQIQLTIGSKTAYHNGTAIGLSVPVNVVNGSTLVPLRFVSEALGANVNWDGVTQTITIGSGIFTPAPIQTSGPLTWLDGTTYVGEVKNGQPHGQGTMTWLDGKKYTGKWENGKLNGVGTMTSPDGFRYEGEWKDGKPNGLGTKISSDGFKFIGSHEDGLPHGFGTGIWPTGERYIGQWQNGFPHGQGTYTWQDGSKYVGEWRNFKPHGQGSMIWTDGNVLSGIWVNGTPPIPTSTETTIPAPSPVLVPAPTPTPAPVVASSSWILVADDGKATYLGKLTTNKFDSESIFNEFGTYGSKFSTKSIWNEFGSYGSKFSLYSAFNEFTTRPPMILDGKGNVKGRLSVNSFVPGAISPYAIYSVLKDRGM